MKNIRDVPCFQYFGKELQVWLHNHKVRFAVFYEHLLKVVAESQTKEYDKLFTPVQVSLNHPLCLALRVNL